MTVGYTGGIRGRGTSPNDYAGVNPLSGHEELEDRAGLEAPTEDPSGEPNEAEDPAADESADHERR